MEKTTTSAAVSKSPDADIITAWGRRSVASAIYAALPYSDCPEGAYTPDEQAQLDIIDEAEAVINAATALTTQGVAVQVWVGLAHMLTDKEADAAIDMMDLDWFLADEARFDWQVRLCLAALRSLREMTPAPVGWDILDWLRRFEAVGGSLHATSVGVQLHGRSIEEQQAARAVLDEIEVDPARKETVRRLAQDNPVAAPVIEALASGELK